jgi:hypothetical protein
MQVFCKACPWDFASYFHDGRSLRFDDKSYLAPGVGLVVQTEHELVPGGFHLWKHIRNCPDYKNWSMKTIYNFSDCRKKNPKTLSNAHSQRNKCSKLIQNWAQKLSHLELFGKKQLLEMNMLSQLYMYVLCKWIIAIKIQAWKESLKEEAYTWWSFKTKDQEIV